MNIKEKLNKKPIKLLALLLTSMLIATVSAQIYNYMYITGSGQITATGLKWELGSDAAGTGASISGGTVSGVALNTSDGNKRNYTDCLRLVNLDDATHDFSIEVTSSPSSALDKANFTEFNLVLFDASWAQQAVLDLKTLDSATGLTIPNLATWHILFELIPIASATTGATVSFEVTLTYE